MLNPCVEKNMRIVNNCVVFLLQDPFSIFARRESGVGFEILPEGELFGEAVVWFAVIFFISFRSPLYWKLGKKAGYALTEQSAFGTMES